MQKFVAVAALCVASFVMPVLPTQAAPALSDAETNCLIFPMLKKECWQMGADMAMAVPATVATATVAAADAAVDTAEDIKLPLWPTCTKAPAGSGHLLDC
ncbi:MAG: hypothetical protein EON57_16470 [Alphaproteobacteria bacterium]|nr:MAG: hypothetical protein EON57_16470 [Alphaproteobacteria bacterium]